MDKTTTLAPYNRIADAVLGLDEYPDRFRLVVFEPEHSQGLHQMIVDNYLIFYSFFCSCFKIYYYKYIEVKGYGYLRAFLISVYFFLPVIP